MTFERRFKIKTDIEYLEDLEVEPKSERGFKRSWNRFFPRAKSIISPYRADRFDAFFHQLTVDGTDERYCRRVVIKDVGKGVGFGVFALKEIPPYSTLHHYTGVLTFEENLDPDHDSTFSFTDYRTYSIDAMKKGNWTRFMNHSAEGDTHTNVIPWEHYLPEGPRVVFTSGRHGIKRGKQLLYSYGDEYWMNKEFVNL